MTPAARATLAARAARATWGAWGAWFVTRGLMTWGAASSWYGTGTGDIQPWSDINLYGGYAERIVGGAVPYAEVAVEYPAASLPLIVGPELLARLPWVTFLGAFIGLALLLDLTGFLAVRRLARRWGGTVGPWAWVVGIALLGPLVLLRLDLLPVVAVLWAAERAAAGRWRWTGGLLVLGGAAKLWPGGLLPAAGVAAPRWRRVVEGAAIAGVAVLAVSAPVLGPMLDASVLRNLGRGLQVETLWASVLLLLDVTGLSTATVGFDYGAGQVTGPGDTALLWLARAVPVVVVLLGAWLARRRPGRSPAVRHVHAAEAATLVLVAGSTVLSPQFLPWAVGAVTAVACTGGPSRVRRRLVLVGVAGALTAVEFPWLYDALTDLDTLPVVVVAVRNLLLVAAAVDAVRDAARGGPPLSAAPTASAAAA